MGLCILLIISSHSANKTRARTPRSAAASAMKKTKRIARSDGESEDERGESDGTDDYWSEEEDLIKVNQQ